MESSSNVQIWCSKDDMFMVIYQVETLYMYLMLLAILFDLKYNHFSKRNICCEPGNPPYYLILSKRQIFDNGISY